MTSSTKPTPRSKSATPPLGSPGAGRLRAVVDELGHIFEQVQQRLVDGSEILAGKENRIEEVLGRVGAIKILLNYARSESEELMGDVEDRDRRIAATNLLLKYVGDEADEILEEARALSTGRTAELSASIRERVTDLVDGFVYGFGALPNVWKSAHAEDFSGKRLRFLPRRLRGRAGNVGDDWQAVGGDLKAALRRAADE